MNTDAIINRVKPYLNENNELYEEDFITLFAIFRKHEKYKIVDLLIKKNIEINYDPKPVLKKTPTISNVNKNIKSCLGNGSKPVMDLTNMSNEQLCIMYQNGKDEVLYSLYKKNEGFINKMVGKYEHYYNQKLTFDDLKIEAFFGLKKAVEKYDHSMEFKFITYAGSWIMQSISRAIADYGFTIRIPVHMFEKVNKVFGILKDNQLEPNSLEAYEVVSGEMDLTELQYKEVVRIMSNIIRPVSLDLPVGEDGDSTLADFVDEHIPDVVEEVAQHLLCEDLSCILESLTDRERDIITMRFGLEDGKEMTLEEIGKDFNVTRERIRQIEAKALRKLRHPSRSRKIKGYLGG